MLLDFRATDKLRGQNGSLTTVIDTLLPHGARGRLDRPHDAADRL